MRVSLFGQLLEEGDTNNNNITDRSARHTTNTPPARLRDTECCGCWKNPLSFLLAGSPSSSSAFVDGPTAFMRLLPMTTVVNDGGNHPGGQGAGLEERRRGHTEFGISNDETSMGHRCHSRTTIPTVTLFFDTEKDLTVACLARRTASLDIYFQCRVESGTAVARSPFYYELRGYLRENWRHIQRYQKGFFHPGDITVALGQLQSSDQALRQKLETIRLQRLQKRHGANLGRHPDHDCLEKVLEIASLQRLNDDLDVVSIYCMMHTSRVFRIIATKLAHERMRTASLVVTPYVDGTAMYSYSKFIRGNVDGGVGNHATPNVGNPFSRFIESGRTIEYQQLPSIPLVWDHVAHKKQSIGTPMTTGHATTATASPWSAATYIPQNSPPASHFSWDCQELSFATLHGWWGDIATVQDYVGHKLVLSWESRGGPDQEYSATAAVVGTSSSTNPPPSITTPPHLEYSLRDHLQTVTTKQITTTAITPDTDTTTLKLAHWRLLDPQTGKNVSIVSPFAKITIRIDLAQTQSSLNEVTTSHQGRASILQIQLNFNAFVRAAARQFLTIRNKNLSNQHEHSDDDHLSDHVILRHEEEYIQVLQKLAQL